VCEQRVRNRRSPRSLDADASARLERAVNRAETVAAYGINLSAGLEECQHHIDVPVVRGVVQARSHRSRCLRTPAADCARAPSERLAGRRARAAVMIADVPSAIAKRRARCSRSTRATSSVAAILREHEQRFLEGITLVRAGSAPVIEQEPDEVGVAFADREMNGGV
jgi:hypothetical protein